MCSAVTLPLLGTPGPTKAEHFAERLTLKQIDPFDMFCQQPHRTTATPPHRCPPLPGQTDDAQFLIATFLVSITLVWAAP